MRRSAAAIATQTQPETRNRDDILVLATRILGFPIDVVWSREGARRLYQGVVHLPPQSSARRLVVEIGGRSTELIRGHASKPDSRESFRVGTRSLVQALFFAAGEFSTQAFRMAEIAAKAVLDAARRSTPPRRLAGRSPTPASALVGAVGATF